MNRRQRRAHDPAFARRIRELQHRVEATGQPGYIYGLTHACRDCGATATIEVLPGNRAVSHIWHDDGCPADASTIPWQAVTAGTDSP